jgi:hypothetical protein
VAAGKIGLDACWQCIRHATSGKRPLARVTPYKEKWRTGRRDEKMSDVTNRLGIFNRELQVATRPESHKHPPFNRITRETRLAFRLHSIVLL